MKRIEIKNRFTGKVIHSYECEGNTVKITLLNGAEVGANLKGANLQGANLQGAYLKGAYLKGSIS